MFWFSGNFLGTFVLFVGGCFSSLCCCCCSCKSVFVFGALFVLLLLFYKLLNGCCWFIVVVALLLFLCCWLIVVFNWSFVLLAIVAVAVAHLTIAFFWLFCFCFACLCFVWLKIPKRHFPCDFRALFPFYLPKKKPLFKSLFLLSLLFLHLLLLSPFLPSSSLFPLFFANPFSGNVFGLAQYFFIWRFLFDICFVFFWFCLLLFWKSQDCIAFVQAFFSLMLKVCVSCCWFVVLGCFVWFVFFVLFICFCRVTSLGPKPFLFVFLSSFCFLFCTKRQMFPLKNRTFLLAFSVSPLVSP